MFGVPPLEAEDLSHHETRLHALRPQLLLLGLLLWAAAIGASAGLLARGEVVIGSILLAIAVLALLVAAQETLRPRTSAFEGLVAGGYDRMRSLSGYASASVRTWSRTGGRVARLRLEMRKLLSERKRAQYELGGAAYAGDSDAVASLVERMRDLDEQLTTCAAETERALAEAQAQLAQERLAIGSTEVRRAAP